MNKTIVAILISCFFVFSSCSKNSDFIDNTSQFPLNWKSSDDFTLITNTYLDTIDRVLNIGTCPLGSIQDPNFGLFESSLYAEFQTTASSLKFTFTTVDSVILFMPYPSDYQFVGDVSKPFTFEVYEMTQGIDTSRTNTNTTYSYNPAPIGTLANYKVNYTDSVKDGNTVLRPTIKIPLSIAFANKLIAPGEYASNDDLHAIFKGVYIKTNSNSGGFVNVQTSINFKIKIYGKNASGTSLTSEFITGGVNSNTVNTIFRDPSSIAYAASQNKPATGSPKMYTRGIKGFYGQFKIPDTLASFAKDKSIFKAELSLYLIDSSFNLSEPALGILLYNDSSNRNFVIDDHYYAKDFFLGIKDTLIGGMNVKEYKYNIGMLLNNLVRSTNLATANIRVYPLPISPSTIARLSDVVPSAAIIGGTGSPYAPRLKIYYTEN